MPGIWGAPPLDRAQMRADSALLIGLTGGIGSGKTTVANTLEEMGARVIDADAIAHQLTSAGGEAIAHIAREFGSKMITEQGALDRGQMRGLAFGDPAARRRLESILHPLVHATIDKNLAEINRGVLQISAPAKFAVSPAYVVLVIPLLFETNFYTRKVNRVAVIDCPESRQVEQVIVRSSLAAGEVRKIMATQAPRALRLQLADDVLCNFGTKEALRASAIALHSRYVGLAGGAGASTP